MEDVVASGRAKKEKGDGKKDRGDRPHLQKLEPSPFIPIYPFKEYHR
jgi:hypothetical protein